MYAQWMQNVMAYRARHLRGSGSTVVTLEAVRAKEANAYAVVACIDSSRTDMIEVDTKKSIIPTPRPNPRVTYTYLVTKDTTSQRWYISGEKVTGTC